VKYAIGVLLISAIAIGATEPAKPEENPIKWGHIVADDGEILATINLKDNKIDYKGNPKDIVSLLLRRIEELKQNCAAAIKQCQDENKPKPKGPLKK
jgi:hypothetical protein